MGVDAVMRFIGPKLTDAQIRRMAFEMYGAFGSGPFHYGSDERDEPAIHEVVPSAGNHDDEDSNDPWDLEGRPSLPEGWARYAVGLLGRYWGPGYERGDFPTLYALMRWMLNRSEVAELFYDGDSGSTLDRVTEETLAAFWSHFQNHGCRPYRHRDGFACSRLLQSRKPKCARCHETMVEHGIGPQWSLVACVCGYELESKDSGVNWSKPVRK